ncbi:PREDICTED: protein Brevis radix-like 4 isoform X1 [Lupinus angustifolius]|uniref:protein Brevis radix-like 4 isoform X1 n=1 Tax=Lupinus angustifolius TaxID=3871 RepID=UPI00092EF0AF|nr:PREDICTED: protein Brevis radix-like 4 isoform X1 [Lupinus angustifolius]
MLTCIPRTKKLGDDSLSHQDDSDPNNNAKNNNQAVKSITSQIKDMALKASGVYKHCGTCTGPSRLGVSNKGESLSPELESERFRRLYRRNGSGSSSRRMWGKELEERLKGISSGEGTPSSGGGGGSGRRVVVVVEEEEGKEWVAQVESGVLISFVSLPGGGNHLKRIRFSRDIFNKWQAQRWWAENFDKVMELYNVQRVNHQAFPLPTPPRSEDESSKHESVEDIPATPPLTRERLPRNLYRPTGIAMGYSSSDSFDVQSMQSRHHNDSTGMNSTPKVSTISAAKTEISSMDASIRSCSSREADYSEDISISNVSDMETEWVEEDEPGVYITIKAMPGGKREIKRVRFSREKFGEVHARLWWEENRARIHELYL